MNMDRFYATAASYGISICKIKVINRRITGFKRVVLAPHREKSLYDAAVILAKDELNKIILAADKEHKEILNFQLMLLDDFGLNELVLQNISDGQGAALSVENAMNLYCQKLKDIGDEYISQRTYDIRDVLERVVDILDGRSRERFMLTEPSIVIADEILPSDLASMSREYACGFITVGGSYQSHSNIIARSMEIPSVYGISSEVLNPLNDGKLAIVDGLTGEVYINPNEATIARYKHTIKKEQVLKASAVYAIKQPLFNEHGKRVNIYANCDDPFDISKSINNGACGIGLVRSEILCMKDVFPTLNVQIDFYKKCITASQDKYICLRVFDIGADKSIDGLNFESEPNPALGVRGIRLRKYCNDLFTDQIKALYIACDKIKRINVMLPMVTNEKDVIEFIEFAENIKQDLLKSKTISNDNIDWGIMIEVPAAALISDKLAKLVKFFSIGTNDLTQYTLAADRVNVNVECYYDFMNEGLMSLINMVIKNAHNEGIPVSICGESAANFECAKAYIEMGVDTLSMAQGAIIPLKTQLLENFSKK